MNNRSTRLKPLLQTGRSGTLTEVAIILALIALVALAAIVGISGSPAPW